MDIKKELADAVSKQNTMFQEFQKSEQILNKMKTELLVQTGKVQALTDLLTPKKEGTKNVGTKQS